MRGASATRFCDSCRKHVTNLSALTRAQARDFLAENAGRNVCVRYRVGRDGEIVHEPATPVRLAFVAALSLAMAACTGYVDADELDSPDDALVCHDAAGYAVPCDEVDEGVVPYADAVPPAGDEPEPETEPGAEPEAPEPPDVVEVEFLGQAVSEPVSGEGCPIPTPDEGDFEMGEMDPGDELMGDIVAPMTHREARRAERRERREERRDARRERRG